MEFLSFRWLIMEFLFRFTLSGDLLDDKSNFYLSNQLQDLPDLSDLPSLALVSTSQRIKTFVFTGRLRFSSFQRKCRMLFKATEPHLPFYLGSLWKYFFMHVPFYNGRFPKFEVLYYSQNTVKSIKIQ